MIEMTVNHNNDKNKKGDDNLKIFKDFVELQQKFMNIDVDTINELDDRGSNTLIEMTKITVNLRKEYNYNQYSFGDSYYNRLDLFACVDNNGDVFVVTVVNINNKFSTELNNFYCPCWCPFTSQIIILSSLFSKMGYEAALEQKSELSDDILNKSDNLLKSMMTKYLTK